jgi:hypothetical protein
MAKAAEHPFASIEHQEAFTKSLPYELLTAGHDHVAKLIGRLSLPSHSPKRITT